MEKKIIDGVLQQEKEQTMEVLENKEKQDELLNKAEDFAKKQQKNLQEYWSEMKSLLSLLRDYFSGGYDKIPKSRLVLAIASLLYVISPFKILPKWLPFSTLLDRSLVMIMILEYLKTDIEEYEKWAVEKGG